METALIVHSLAKIMRVETYNVSTGNMRMLRADDESKLHINISECDAFNSFVIKHM